MDLKGGTLHSRTGGDRPSHGHQGGDSSDEQPWMVSGFDSQDGGGSGNRPCRRVRHDRGACRGVTVAQRLPGCRPIDRCIAVYSDYAEPWQWLGQHELPEYVATDLQTRRRRRDFRSERGSEPAATCRHSMRAPSARRKSFASCETAASPSSPWHSQRIVTSSMPRTERTSMENSPITACRRTRFSTCDG